MKRLFTFVLWAACMPILLSGCSGRGNETGNINQYAPIALLDDAVVYDYIADGGALVIGCYDFSSKRQADAVSVEGFYISSGMPAVIGESVVLPITLNTNEHQLLMVDADSGSYEVLFSEFNPCPMDTVSVMNTDIYMLSTIKDDVAATGYIRKYNENTGGMDICIEKQFTDVSGGQITAFACSNGNIYVVVNNMETENDAYVEIYDGKNYDLTGKLYFDSELGNFVSNNGIVEFYCFGSYIYVRNFLDYGAIGKMENGQIKTFLALPDLRMVHNGQGTQDDCYGFFIRSGKEFYFLDVYTNALYKTNLELSQDESIRNAVTDGNNICVSILDERDTEAFTTKKTIMVDFNELREKANQTK